MQIYAYPGERVDFVSKSGGAGAIYFGDTRALCEEFFGTPHTDDGTTITYFAGSIALDFADRNGEQQVAAIRIAPQRGRERIDVYLGKQRLSGLDPADAEELAASASSVRLEFGEGLELAEFRA